MLHTRGASIGTNDVFHRRLFVRGKGQLDLRDRVVINSCFEANPISGGYCSIFLSKCGSISFGKNVGISNSSFYSERSITVEDDVFIGNGCTVWDSNFHPISFQTVLMGMKGLLVKQLLLNVGRSSEDKLLSLKA